MTKMLYFMFCILPGNKNKVYLFEGRKSVALKHYRAVLTVFWCKFTVQWQSCQISCIIKGRNCGFGLEYHPTVHFVMKCIQCTKTWLVTYQLSINAAVKMKLTILTLISTIAVFALAIIAISSRCAGSPVLARVTGTWIRSCT